MTNRPQPKEPQAAQARAKIENMKRAFEQKRAIADSFSRIKNKIGVYSGKGGVGKTTVAVNLAVTLAQDGAKTGILDVDIDCPNVVRAMKVFEPPEVGEDKKLIPSERFGVKVMSMGFFQQNEEEAIIWRGPMIHNAINQLLQSTDWGELDYLLIDLPPGTSDSPLTVMQALTLDGFIVVTSPQELAKIDAMRSINMIKTLKVNVLGVVENFSGEIFGSGARRRAGRADGPPLLGPAGAAARLPRHLQADCAQQQRGAVGVQAHCRAGQARPGAGGGRRRVASHSPTCGLRVAVSPCSRSALAELREPRVSGVATALSYTVRLATTLLVASYGYGLTWSAAGKVGVSAGPTLSMFFVGLLCPWCCGWFGCAAARR